MIWLGQTMMLQGWVWQWSSQLHSPKQLHHQHTIRFAMSSLATKRHTLQGGMTMIWFGQMMMLNVMRSQCGVAIWPQPTQPHTPEHLYHWHATRIIISPLVTHRHTLQVGMTMIRLGQMLLLQGIMSMVLWWVYQQQKTLFLYYEQYHL